MIDINQALVAIGVLVGVLLVAGVILLAFTIRRNRQQSRNSMPQYGRDRSKFGEELRRKQSR